MIATTVVIMITEVARAVTAVANGIASPSGQKLLDRWEKNAEQFEKDMQTAGDNFKKLFAGDFFKALEAPVEQPGEVQPKGVSGE